MGPQISPDSSNSTGTQAPKISGTTGEELRECIPVFLASIVFFGASRLASVAFPLATASAIGIYSGSRMRTWFKGAGVGLLGFFMGMVIFPFQQSFPPLLSYNEMNVFYGAQDVLVNVDRPFISMAALVICALVAHYLREKKEAFGRYLAPVLVCLALSLVSLGPSVISPPLLGSMRQDEFRKGYIFDGEYYYNTLNLMKKGHNYYEAARIAQTWDARTYYKVLNTTTLRLPYIFWVWKALGSHAHVLQLLWILAACSCISIFLLLRGLGVPDIESAMGTFLVAPWWIYVSSNWWFNCPEAWAAPFVFAAITFFVYDRFELAIISAFAAVLMRELFMPFTLLLSAVSLLSSDRARKKRIVVLVAGLMGFIGISYYFHYVELGKYFNSLGPAHLLISRFTGDLKAALRSFYFGHILISQRIWLLPLLAASSIAGILSVKGIKKWFLLLFFLLYLFMSIVFGRPYSEYYGWLYTPYLVALAPLLLSRSPQRRGERLTKC